MNPVDPHAPDTPICKVPGNEEQPCPFAKICGTTRQRIQSGYHWVRDPEQSPVRLQGTPEKGAWFQREDPMWGDACVHYQHLSDGGLIPPPKEAA